MFFRPRIVLSRLIALAGGFVLTAGLTATSSFGQIISSRGPVPTSNSIETIQNASAVCPKCGRVHGNSNSVNGTATIRQASASAPVTVPSYSGSTGLRATGGTSNVLSALNSQRARQGLGSLQYDPALQAVAARRAQMMASTRNKSHPPGSFSPGRYEGVGWSSSYSPAGVSACFTSDPNMRVAGAAMARGSDGVYFCVVYR